MTGNYRKRDAILCGVSEYSKLMGSNLPGVSTEIDTIEVALRDHLHEGYRYKVKSYKNNQLGLDDIPVILAPYKQDSQVDEMLFYFSGHGTIYNDEAYFVTYGARDNNPGIKLSNLLEELTFLHLGIKQIFAIFDFCYSGAALEFANKVNCASERVALLTATRKNQIAEVVKESAKSENNKSFADYFIDGLTNASSDQNGEISFGRLALYISEKMKGNHSQSSVFYSQALTGHPINKINKKFFVPYRQNQFFTGRKEILSAIKATLKDSNDITLTQAISGLGGIGKTQTAIEFCYRYKNNYEPIFWTRSENEAEFNTSYLEQAKKLKLISDKDIEQGLKIEEIIETFKTWLSNNSNWLMVLDNLENVDLIRKYLPNNYQGYILITTRSQSLKGYTNIIPLKKMSIETGILFLLKRASLITIPTKTDENNKPLDELLGNLPEQEKKDAKEIVKEMDGLPLALEQAGAYINETKCSLSDYLSAYKDIRNTIIMLNNEGEDVNDHKSVFATFKLAFDKVKEQSPAAVDFLKVCSFLSSDLIPEEIFTKAGNLLSSELAILGDNTFYFNNMIRVLLNYSLIERDSNNKNFSIHRLVQTVIRDLISDMRNLLVENIVKALHSIFPNSNNNRKDWFTTWPTCERLLPHVKAISPLAKIIKFELLENGMLLHNTSLYCKEQGSYSEALDLSVAALEVTENNLGNNHSILSRILYIQADLYNFLGNYQQAETIYSRSLKLIQENLGDQNLEMATVLNNVGDFHYKQGKIAQAEKELTKALRIRETLLAPNTLEISITLNNLALVYQRQANYLQAKELFAKAIKIMEEVNGENHPDLAAMLLNLGGSYLFLGDNIQAKTYIDKGTKIIKESLETNLPRRASMLHSLGKLTHNQGNYAQAKQSYKEALSIKENLLGAENPNLAQFLNDFASLENDCGEILEAENLFKRVWCIAEKTFPHSHPDFLAALNNLFSFYDSHNRSQEAEEFFEKLVNILPDIENTSHPDIGTILNNLAEFYRKKQKYEEAKPLYEKALEIERKALGETSYIVATTLENKALLCFNLAQYDEAEILLKQVLEIRKQVFGSNDLKVANTLWNLGKVYLTQEKLDEAEACYEEELRIKKKKFGENDIKITDTLDQLSIVCFSEDNKEAALNFSNQSLTIKKNSLPENDDSIADTLGNIATIYKLQGKYSEALDSYNQALSIYKNVFGEKNIASVIILIHIGEIYLDQGKHEEVLNCHNQLLLIHQHNSGNKHPNVATTLNDIGNLYQSQGKYSEAIDFYNQALSIYEYHNNNLPDAATTLVNMGILHESMSEETKAINYYKQALSIYDQCLSPNNSFMYYLLDIYSKLLLKLNRNDEAKPLLDRLAVLEESTK